MDARKAAQLREAWGDKPCDHPKIEPVGHSGLEACAQCGQVFTKGKPG